jgi:hypothetical protein
MKRGAPRLFFSRPGRLRVLPVAALRVGLMNPSLARPKNESGLTL